MRSWRSCWIDWRILASLRQLGKPLRTPEARKHFLYTVPNSGISLELEILIPSAQGHGRTMAILDHWHPVLPSRSLKRNRIAGVRLAGRDLALFRNAKGDIGALDNVCPHRRMRLDLGKVHNDKLQCGYHGWTFDACGNGESPATPKLYACAEHYEVREAFEAIWVRSAGATTAFPSFEVDGHFNVCNLHHRVRAPLELTLDNFCEIEHTPTTHAFFGYPLERMHEVQVEFHPTEDSVRVINWGPRKPISLFLRTIVGIGNDYLFMDDWTTHFSPVY